MNRAKNACVGCHGPHPSARAGHRKAAEEGQLGCVTCHTIHGPQSGVLLPPSGSGERYSVWGKQAVPDVTLESGRKVLVPTIHAGACLTCHEDDPRDPFARCLSRTREGALDPTICFDEHHRALGQAPRKSDGV